MSSEDGIIEKILKSILYPCIETVAIAIGVGAITGSSTKATVIACLVVLGWAITSLITWLYFGMERKESFIAGTVVSLIVAALCVLVTLPFSSKKPAAESPPKSVVEEYSSEKSSATTAKKTTSATTVTTTVPVPQPVYICDLDYFAMNGWWVFHDEYCCVENTGKEHEHTLVNTMNSRDILCYETDYIQYYIDGKYKLFTGTVAVPSCRRESDAQGYFQIYGDDTLLYTSPLMKNTSLPEEFKVDISNVTILEVRYPYDLDNTIYGNNDGRLAIIYDGKLIP